MPASLSRRFALLALVLLSATLAACSTLGALGGLLGNQVTFTAPQLQQHLDRRFPREYDRLGGLVSVTLLNPRLSIPAGDSRLRLDFDIGIGGLAGDGRNPAGHFAIASALRFDPQTRGLHLDNPSLETVDVPALGGALRGNARELINRWLVDYARDEPVYRLDEGFLGNLGARRIGRTSIENGLVVVYLDQ